MGKKKNKRVTRPIRTPEAGAIGQAPTGSSDFSPDYSYVRKDLRRIALLGGGILAVLIVLSFFLN